MQSHETHTFMDDSDISCQGRRKIIKGTSPEAYCLAITDGAGA